VTHPLKSGALYRTVTITRTLEQPERCDSPFEAITCEMVCDSPEEDASPESWRPNLILDEMGEAVLLTETESLLARCFAAAGLDEAGH